MYDAVAAGADGLPVSSSAAKTWWAAATSRVVEPALQALLTCTVVAASADRSFVDVASLLAMWQSLVIF